MTTLTDDFQLDSAAFDMNDGESPETLSIESQFTALQIALDAPVRRFVRHMLSSRPDIVDDVMQEMYIALFERVETLARDHTGALRPDAIRPYAFGIARNLCYEELRQQRRKASDDDFALEDELQFDDVSGTRCTVLADEAAAPDDVTHWLLLNAEVQTAIDRLPELQRQVLIMYTQQEMSYVEIAEIMGVNIGTVKSRLFYAKRALRGLLSPATLQALDDSLGEFG